MIPFSIPTYTGRENDHVLAAMRGGGGLSGDGEYGKRCERWFEGRVGSKRTLLVPSCTHALELAALLIGIKPGDEVIMPSYTFVSTANAFVVRGAKVVFIDVDPRTMNMDAEQIEDAITSKTKVLVPVHYAGVACDMRRILEIAKVHDLKVVEDAAQGVGSTYYGKPLGHWDIWVRIAFMIRRTIRVGVKAGCCWLTTKIWWFVRKPYVKRVLTEVIFSVAW